MNTITKKRIFSLVLASLILIFASSIFLAGPVSAQWDPSQPLVPCGGSGQPQCTRCEIFHLIKNLIDFGLLFVLPIGGTLMFVYAGVLYVISAGNSGVQSRARGIFTNTLYATIVICLAWVITNTILVNLGDNVGGTWYQFQCSATP